MTTYKVLAGTYAGHKEGEEFEADDITEEDERDFIERGWIEPVKETKRKEEGKNG